MEKIHLNPGQPPEHLQGQDVGFSPLGFRIGAQALLDHLLRSQAVALLQQRARQIVVGQLIGAVEGQHVS